MEYSHQVRLRSPETWVFWIHASNADRFEESLRDLASGGSGLVFVPVGMVLNVRLDESLDGRHGERVRACVLICLDGAGVSAGLLSILICAYGAVES